LKPLSSHNYFIFYRAVLQCKNEMIMKTTYEA
jgi:hypothetical protein